MNIRLLRPEERYDALLISKIAFHGRIDDLKKAEEDARKETVEDWGAFSDQGKLMARIINNRYTVCLDGARVPCGGIGAVSTLPEYREEGAIRAIFQQLLARARENGEVLSALYPFNHAFYRKFGYETVCKENTYSLTPDLLHEYHFHGQAVLFTDEKDVHAYTKIYSDFISRYNLAMVRSDEMMLKDHLKAAWYQDRQFSYLLVEEGTPEAYVTFQDEQARLKVRDLAWSGRKGFYAILGFLSRFTADYDRIELLLPPDIELLEIIQCRNAYAIEKSTAQGYMVRAVHVPELLKTMEKPDGESMVIEVKDDLIPENNGIYQVQGHDAVRVQETPDLIVSERALAQMAVGAVSFYEAALRRDVTVLGNEEKLERFFHRKPLWVSDHF